MFFKLMRLGLVLTFYIAFFPLVSQSYAASEVGVLIGGSDDYDACSVVGVVAGLKVGGDGYLAVRSGPGTNYSEKDRISNNTQLYICDEDGSWLGIVYGNGLNCGVSSPISIRDEYVGPCYSGWVHKRYIKEIAG